MYKGFDTVYLINTKMDLKSGRTRGDGMEQEGSPSDPSLSKTLPRNTVSIPGEQLIYKPNSVCGNMPKGKIFNLIPKLIVSNRRTQNLNKREPRFVPFEPYKAAVNPIIPYKKVNLHPKIDRNNLDLNVLISQMSEMKASEMNSPALDKRIISLGALSTPGIETQALQKEIQELKKERDYYNKELKFQCQVNSELKKLLVAAVGEDIQTKVNVLTEDKLQLARALLDTAQNLSSHTEQIEFLAGQSEVWRSKFLASSLMVEELARWKASLTQKNDLLFTSNKHLLETMAQVRDMEAEILKNMVFITQMDSLALPSSNVLDIAAEIINISQQLVLHSGIGMPKVLDLKGLDALTPAEKLAIEALENTNQPLMAMDDAFRAIFNKAFMSNIKNNTDVPSNKSITKD